MKKISVFLLMMTFGLVGIGCDSNDDDDHNIEELLEGNCLRVSIEQSI